MTQTQLDAVIGKNEILSTVLGDAFDANIDLGYEENVCNEVSGWDNGSLCLLFLLYLRNLLFP